LKIYNTITREKEDFVPLNPPHVLYYNCGPTVYDYFHIGNARNFVVADTIRRYLEYRGFKVRFIQNLTDIDDKIIKKAKEEGITAKEVAEKYTAVYFEQTGKLGIRTADMHPKATENIPQMHALIKTLIEKGHAYVVDGDVYFSVRSFPSYGSLSGKNIEDLQEGARVDVDERKKDPLDFALWKAAKPGEPAWESPWGPGRPGWHIECSAMSIAHLGESIDIHSGATDLIFPHHENERAQSEAATGKPFVKYWLHNGFLNINNQKMSKSLGNFFTINQVLERYDPLSVKFFLLSAHYRHPLDYTEENMATAQSASRRILDALETVDKLININALQENSMGLSAPEFAREKWVNFRRAFEDAMDDDFNTAKALSVLHDIVSEIHETRKAVSNAPQDAALLDALKLYRNLLLELLGILGLDPTLASGKVDFNDKIIGELMQILIDIRKLARAKKDFIIADEIRNRLNNISITLEDHPQGTIWKQKK